MCTKINVIISCDRSNHSKKDVASVYEKVIGLQRSSSECGCKSFKLYMYETIRYFTTNKRGQTFKHEPTNQYIMNLSAYI